MNAPPRAEPAPVPPSLHGPALEAALEAFARAAAERPALLEGAPRALGASPWLAGLCTSHGAEVRALVASGALDAGADAAARDAGIEAELESRVAGLPVGPGDDAEALGALREVRRAEQFRLLWRMIVHDPPLEDTFRGLSALADACVRVAARRAGARTARRHGRVRGPDGEALEPVIVAMGKLGGGELNVSSDIDLIGLHPNGGAESDGARPLSAGEWFARAFRETVRLLAARTADGIVFRVDVRLRPFGESGPPVTSLEALGRYWRDHGRDWERYAMVKARALTGSPSAIAAFEAMRAPFVYRRYPDYAAIASLRELKAMIAASAAERAARRRAGATGTGTGGREAAGAGGAAGGAGAAPFRRFAGDDDVKLGRGGIREVEFVVQAHQLVRGGREPALTGRALLPTLDALDALGVVPPEDVRALEAAYRALRRVENALQGVHDAQTHVLPEDPDERARVALALGAPDFAAARAALDVQRAAVADRFDALFAGEGIGTGGTAGAADEPPAEAPPADEPPPADPRSAAPDPDHPALAALRGGPARRRLPERSAARLDRLLPRVLDAVADAARESGAAPVDEVLARVADFLGAAAGRGGYLQVLLDRPAALSRLVSLFARSAWVAREVRDHPVLVESLLADRKLGPFVEGGGADACGPTEARAGAARALAGVAEDDLEFAMAKLRRFRRASAFDIAVARLDGAITLMQTSDRLTWLAEAVIGQTLERVTAPLRARHGVPSVGAGAEARPVGLAVIAYGKLGGLELGFESDLDLVFLHDAPPESQGETDGPEPVANAVWFARLVRRFTHFMATATEAGALYEIDLRLRPNGTAGLLVTSLDAFAGYQRDSAWTWEHQALLRARAVGGDAALAARFEALRTEILCRRREPERLARDVADMRARMVEALGTSPPGRLHLKRDPGGMTDLEFVVQHLALAHAAEHPEIVRHSDNVRVIEAARETGVLADERAGALTEAWLALRERAFDAVLALEGPEVELDPALERIAATVRELRAEVLGPLA